PVSQPSAPDRRSLPMIELSYAPLHARRVAPTDSPAPKLFEGAAWKFKLSARGVGSTGSEPLRRRIGPRVVGALTPVSAGRGRERGRWALRRLAGGRGRGFVSPRRAEP